MMYDTEEQREIDAWDAQVSRKILQRGQYYGVNPDSGKNFVIEAEAYRADDSIDSFRGWWTDDDGMASYGDTPYEVWLDLLDSEP